MVVEPLAQWHKVLCTKTRQDQEDPKLADETVSSLYCVSLIEFINSPLVLLGFLVNGGWVDGVSLPTRINIEHVGFWINMCLEKELLSF